MRIAAAIAVSIPAGIKNGVSLCGLPWTGCEKRLMVFMKRKGLSFFLIPGKQGIFTYSAFSMIPRRDAMSFLGHLLSGICPLKKK
jgi:hypothetical protein